MELVSPRAEARSKLLELYKKQMEILGRKPNDEEFFPVDPENLAKNLLPDWKIIENPDLLHRDVSNPILGKADFNQKIIYLDANAQPHRRRYTVAHELGHVFLKHGGCQLRRDVGPRSVLRPEQLEPPDAAEVKREKDANAFAAELLMPERTMLREFKKRFGVDRLFIRSSQAELILNNIYNRAEDAAAQLATSHYPSNSRSLADFFGVSPAAMRVRLLELSLVY
jgi:Zn-dependent peptidase ImmA (M78 family)